MFNIQEKLNVDIKQPASDKYNKQIFEKYKQCFDNIQEFIYCYKNKLLEKPRCKICGKTLNFDLRLYKYYKYCSIQCCNQDKERIEKIRKATLVKDENGNTMAYKRSLIMAETRRKLNSFHTGALKGAETKRKNIDSYGINELTKIALVGRETRKKDIDEFGHNSYQRMIIKRQQDIDSNGLNSIQRAALKNVIKQKANIDENGLNGFQRAALKGNPKRYATLKQNNSYNKSKSEELAYKKLILNFGEEDVVRQYRSEKYPFACDFYIKSIDLYIECHFYVSHNKRPFDKSNTEHLKEIEKLKKKAQEINFKGEKKRLYNQVIKIWTKVDPKKLKTFIENKLNYKIFYTMKEFNEWYASIQKGTSPY